MLVVENLMLLEDDSGYWMWEDYSRISWWGYAYFTSVNHIAYVSGRQKTAAVNYRDKRAKAGE
jgi:hypothetical protein